MADIYRHKSFRDWLSRLRDRKAVELITARIDRLAEGNAGDVKPIGESVQEMRIHFGAGYRIYFMQRGHKLIVLLCGGDKGSQARDIEKAKILAKEWKD